MRKTSAKLVGKKVYIKNGCWCEGHHGYIVGIDSDYGYRVGGGSLDMELIFNRDEFVIPRKRYDLSKFNKRSIR